MAAQKSKAYWASVFFALLTSNAHATQGIVLKLDNHLSACVQISKPTTYSAEGVLFAKFSYVQKDLTAGCGCKSALSSYTAFGGKKAGHAFLMGGNLLFGQAGTMSLPLVLEDLAVPDKTITMSISCANPR